MLSSNDYLGYDVSVLNFITGDYTLLHPVKFDHTPVANTTAINGCGLSPIDNAPYCIVQVGETKDARADDAGTSGVFLARFDFNQMHFLMRLPIMAFSATFDVEGNFYFFRKKGGRKVWKLEHPHQPHQLRDWSLQQDAPDNRELAPFFTFRDKVSFVDMVALYGDFDGWGWATWLFGIDVGPKQASVLIKANATDAPRPVSSVDDSCPVANTYLVPRPGVSPPTARAQQTTMLNCPPSTPQPPSPHVLCTFARAGLRCAHPFALSRTVHAVPMRVVSGTSYCQLDENGCVTDGPGDYGDDEDCTVKTNVAGSLTATDFSTEYNVDGVTIGGIQYNGKDGPYRAAIAAGETFSWHSDGRTPHHS